MLMRLILICQIKNSLLSFVQAEVDVLLKEFRLSVEEVADVTCVVIKVVILPLMHVTIQRSKK